MAFVKVGPASAVPPGTVSEVEIDGTPYAVCNLDGELFALGGICPHAGGRLGHGALYGHYVSCPFHGWEFDCRTGVHDEEGRFRVDTYTVQVEDGQILIDLSARAA